MGCSKSFRSLKAFALGALIGGVAWSGWYPLIALAILMPIAWLRMPRRREVWLLVMGYYLAGSYTLIWGAATYFDSGLFWGVALWLGGALVQSLAWTLPWHRSPNVRAGTLFVAYALSTLPPFGLYGVDHPLTAAGVLFPGTGWIGFIATAFLPLLFRFNPHLSEVKSEARHPAKLRQPQPFGTSRVGQRHHKLMRTICAAFVIASIASHSLNHRQPTPEGWTALQTKKTASEIAGTGIADGYNFQMELIAEAKGRGGEGRVVLLPEAIVTDWTASNAMLWQTMLGNGTSVLVGATITPAGEKYDNVIIGVNKDGAQVLYAQRLPVPVSMYRPWANTGSQAHWFSTPVFTWEGRRVAAVICYEQTQLWPILHSMLHRPDVLVAPANLWWCYQTTLPLLMRNYVRAWGELFGIPTLYAFNT